MVGMQDILKIAGREFRSRLFVGTGKYRSKALMARCHAASGTGMVTLAVRRANLSDKTKESELDFIDRSQIFILPNTAALLHGRGRHPHRATRPRGGSVQLD